MATDQADPAIQPAILAYCASSGQPSSAKRNYPLPPFMTSVRIGAYPFGSVDLTCFVCMTQPTGDMVQLSVKVIHSVEFSVVSACQGTSDPRPLFAVHLIVYLPVGGYNYQSPDLQELLPLLRTYPASTHQAGHTGFN